MHLHILKSGGDTMNLHIKLLIQNEDNHWDIDQCIPNFLFYFLWMIIVNAWQQNYAAKAVYSTNMTQFSTEILKGKVYREFSILRNWIFFIIKLLQNLYV